MLLRVKRGHSCCQSSRANESSQSIRLSVNDVVWPRPWQTHTPSQSVVRHWPTAPSSVPFRFWLCAVIGHTVLAVLVVSPAVACGVAVQAAGLINPQASAVRSKLRLCFPTMTSPPLCLPTQAPTPHLYWLFLFSDSEESLFARQDVSEVWNMPPWYRNCVCLLVLDSELGVVKRFKFWKMNSRKKTLLFAGVITSLFFDTFLL